MGIRGHYGSVQNSLRRDRSEYRTRHRGIFRGRYTLGKRLSPQEDYRNDPLRSPENRWPMENHRTQDASACRELGDGSTHQTIPFRRRKGSPKRMVAYFTETEVLGPCQRSESTSDPSESTSHRSEGAAQTE